MPIAHCLSEKPAEQRRPAKPDFPRHLPNREGLLNLPFCETEKEGSPKKTLVWFYSKITLPKLQEIQKAKKYNPVEGAFTFLTMKKRKKNI